GSPFGKPLGEAPAHGHGQRSPIRVGQQRAEAQVGQGLITGATEGVFFCRECGPCPHSGPRNTERDDYLALSDGRKRMTFAPSRISRASFGLGMVSICAYQRSTVWVNSSISLSRLDATGCTEGSPSAPATQALSAASAGSISRALRPAAMRRTSSQMSDSASK